MGLLATLVTCGRCGLPADRILISTVYFQWAGFPWLRSNHRGECLTRHYAGRAKFRTSRRGLSCQRIQKLHAAKRHIGPKRRDRLRYKALSAWPQNAKHLAYHFESMSHCQE